MNILKITIRQEKPKDFDNVYNVIKRAFAVAEHSDGDEQDLVIRLRKSEAFVPQLSLVAEVNGKVVGHIMFTKLKVGETEQLCLAPLSVLPEYQGKGVGGTLINEGHRIAGEMGYDFSILIGYPSYYSRFGYVNAGVYGIKAPFELPEDVFMAFNLSECDLKIGVVVEYPKEFFEKTIV